jgi:hypothetical protein
VSRCQGWEDLLTIREEEDLIPTSTRLVRSILRMEGLIDDVAPEDLRQHIGAGVVLAVLPGAVDIDGDRPVARDSIGRDKPFMDLPVTAPLPVSQAIFSG